MKRSTIRRYRMTPVSALIGLLVAGLFFGGGWTLYQSGSIEDGWLETTGEVVGVATSRSSKGSTMYAPVVAYTVNGNEYEVTSQTSTSIRPDIGSERVVYYSDIAAEYAKVKHSGLTQGAAIALMLIGVLVVIGLPVSVVRTIKRSREIAQLKQYGQRYDGVVIDVHQKGKVNKQPLSKVIVAASVNGTAMEFESDLVRGAERLELEDLERHPIAVQVYVNPADQEDYYVDVEGVQAISGQRISELIEDARNTTRE